MSIEEHIVQVIGICFILYWSLKTLVISSIRAYKEVIINVHQSVRDIQSDTMQYKIDYELEKMKG